jgi:hypothetical protein
MQRRLQNFCISLSRPANSNRSVCPSVSWHNIEFQSHCRKHHCYISVYVSSIIVHVLFIKWNLFLFA